MLREWRKKKVYQTIVRTENKEKVKFIAFLMMLKREDYEQTWSKDQIWELYQTPKQINDKEKQLKNFFTTEEQREKLLLSLIEYDVVHDKENKKAIEQIANILNLDLNSYKQEWTKQELIDIYDEYILQINLIIRPFPLKNFFTPKSQRTKLLRSIISKHAKDKVYYDTDFHIDHPENKKIINHFLYILKLRREDVEEDWKKIKRTFQHAKNESQKISKNIANSNHTKYQSDTTSQIYTSNSSSSRYNQTDDNNDFYEIYPLKDNED